MNAKAAPIRSAALKLIDVLEDINGEIKAIMRNQGITPSCGPGCGACCRSLVVITLLEAIALEPFVTDEMLTSLAAFQPADRNTHFERGIPCVFLRDESCSVYPSRPGACRFAYVTSPPENCQPGGYGILVDTEEARHVGLDQSRELAASVGLSDCFGPMPVMLRAARMYVEHGSDACRALLDHYRHRAVS